MVFSSLSFLFLFFPLCLLFYFVFKNRLWRNCVLIVFSLIFYSWGEPRNIFLMLAVTLIAYLGGLLIHKLSAENKFRGKKAVFIITVGLILANLLVYKYLNFLSDTLLSILGSDYRLAAIPLPIGISFYTFQILSYVIDLYRGEIELQRNPFWLLLYLSFFPQLIAGPIVRYQTIEKEILERRENFEDFYEGLKRFIAGLVKKVVLANNLAVFVDIVYGGDKAVFGSAMYWLAAIAFHVQLYFDFSGYSDMAIGMGRMFGFHFHENFDHPLISRSITEYYRRWHISLSGWFRDYIYIPLGGNRRGEGRTYLNLFIVWALTGLWHGAYWNFLLWGLFSCALIILEKLFLGRLLEKLPGFVGNLYSLICISLGLVIFYFTDFREMGAALAQLFCILPTDWLGVAQADISVFKVLIFLPLGLLFSFPLRARLEPRGERASGVLFSACVYFAAFALCVIFLLSSTYNPFLYFRF